MSIPATEPAVESARRQRTRARLLDAALEVFAEHGMHAASVEAITERAGFTRGAFYSNFDSKESLMFALAEREHRLDMSSLNTALSDMLPRMKREREAANDPNFPWSLESIMELLDRILEPRGDDRQGCLLQSEFMISALRDPVFARRFSDYEANIVAELAAVVAQALGEIGLRFTAEPVLVLRTLVDLYMSSARLDVLHQVAGIPINDARRELTVSAIVAVLGAHTEPIPAQD